MLQHILRYISLDPFVGIMIRPMTSSTLEAFSDVDWVRDASYRRFSYILQLQLSFLEIEEETHRCTFFD